MARHNRLLSRSRLAAVAALAVSMPLLAALPSAPTALAADPTTPFPGGQFTAVDVPAFPAAFVADSAGGHYSALTEAGTTVMEYDQRSGAPATPSPEVVELWADDEPYPTAGANDAGTGDKHGLDQATHVVAGDLVGGNEWTGQPGIELAWISGAGAGTTLSVSNSQQSGFTFRTSVGIDANPVGLTMLDAATGNPGAVLVAYRNQIKAYRLVSGNLVASTLVSTPQNEPILAIYHRPLHEALANLARYAKVQVNTADAQALANQFMIAQRVSNVVGAFTYTATITSTGISVGSPFGEVVTPPGDWTEATLAYDYDGGAVPTRKTILSAYNPAAAKNSRNVVAVNGGIPTLIDGVCQGDELAAVDIEVIPRGFGDAETHWVCSTVDRSDTQPDEVRQWTGGTSGSPVSLPRTEVAGQAHVQSPQPQIVSPCSYLLVSLPTPLPENVFCTAGFVAGDEPNRQITLSGHGRVAVNTYVSAGPDDTSLRGYLVGANQPDGIKQTTFVAEAVEGSRPSARPVLALPLPPIPTRLRVTVAPQVPELVQSNPVPVAFLAAPPHVAGAGQDADPPEFASTSGSGSSNGTTTESHFGASLGVAYEDPLGAFGVSLQASVENSVETGVETSVEIESSEEFRGLLDKNVVVYNAFQVDRYRADVQASSTGLTISQDQIELDLPRGDDAVMSAASVENLEDRFPAAFGANGYLTPALDQIFEKSTPGDPGGYMHWGSNGQAVEEYCVGSLDGSSADRDLGVNPQVPSNDFNDLGAADPPKPDIHVSNKHQVLVGTGNSEGATFSIEKSNTRSRVETTSFDVSATARVAFVEASVNGGAAWSESWSNTLSQGVGFASFVGHIPESNPFLKKESYNWRSFLCQVKAPGRSGMPVTGWVLNYTVDDYKGSGGLEEMSDLEIVTPKGSVEVSEPRPDLTFEQESGTVQTYDWELQAVNVNHVDGGTISFADPKQSNEQRQDTNTVRPTKDLPPGQLYRWRVKATDFFGNVETSDWEFFRTPAPDSAPQAVIEIDTTTVDAGQTVTFENATVPGAVAPVYTWDFGDGTVETSSEQEVTHTYANAGTYVVTLTVTTAAGTTTDTVEIRVLPKLASDSFRTDEDTVLDEADGVLANDTGVKQALLIRGTDNGTLDFKVDGTFTYTPRKDFCGSDGFTYAAGAVNQVATITVDCVNDAPKAVDDAFTLDEDGQLTVDLLGNDTDVDGDDLTATAGAAGHGTVTKQADGRFTYRPAADWCGEDQFTVTVTDGNGGSATSTARATVRCVNDHPVAADDTYRLDEDTSQTVDLLANDRDADGDPLVLTAGAARNGTVTEGAGGRVTYTPEPDWCGTDRFVATVTDGKGGIDTSVATATVICVNDGPVGSDQDVSLDEDGTITVDPGRDPEGDTLTVTVSDPEHGTVTEDQDGNLVYHPDPDYCGPDSFQVTISDGKGGVTTYTVRVTVECTNDAPVGVNDTATILEDRRLKIDPTVNDTDDGAGRLSVQLAADPRRGDVRLRPNGKVVYIPRRNFCGTDAFTYRAVDDQGVAAAQEATVTVTVECVNDKPRAVRDEFSRTMKRSGKVRVGQRGVLRNDVDVDSTMFPKLVKPPVEGRLRLKRNGSFTYQVKDWRQAPRWIAFEYRACDGELCSPKRRVVLHLR